MCIKPLSLLFGIVAATLAVVFFCSCRMPQSADSSAKVALTMHKAPDWVPGDVLSKDELYKILKVDLDGLRSLDDVRYVPVSIDVVRWMHRQVTGIREESAVRIRNYLEGAYAVNRETRMYESYIDESQDCDDFARQFSFLSKWIIGIRYGLQDATPAIGTLRVYQDHSWGGVEGRTWPNGHVLNWMVLETSRGPKAFVLEPQTGVLEPAALYPNKVLLMMD